MEALSSTYSNKGQIYEKSGPN